LLLTGLSWTPHHDTCPCAGRPHRRELSAQRLCGGVEHGLVRDVLHVAGALIAALQREEALHVCKHT